MQRNKGADKESHNTDNSPLQLNGITCGLRWVGGVAVVILLALALFWPFGAAPLEGAIDSIAVLPIENRTDDPELVSSLLTAAHKEPIRGPLDRDSEVQQVRVRTGLLL